MGQKTILIADDDPVTRRLLEHDLSAAGHRVIQAEDGETAIRLAKQEQPDLIILDIMMPGLDGGDVAQMLRGEPRTWDIPIVFLSSLVTRREEGGENAGEPDDYVLLAKPYRRDDLLRIVEQETRRHSPVGGARAIR